MEFSVGISRMYEAVSSKLGHRLESVFFRFNICSETFGNFIYLKILSGLLSFWFKGFLVLCFEKF